MTCSPEHENQPNEAAIERLQNAIEDIRQRKLPNPIKALGLAALYAENGLNAKAIEILEELIASGIQSAEIFFALGEVYENAGLNQQATENYNKALDLASQVTLAAKAGLAKIEDVLENVDAASNLRQEATVGLEALAEVEQRDEEGQRVSAFVRGEQQFLFLAARGGCGECPGPGKKFFGNCLPCV